MLFVPMINHRHSYTNADWENLATSLGFRLISARMHLTRALSHVQDGNAKTEILPYTGLDFYGPQASFHMVAADERDIFSSPYRCGVYFAYLSAICAVIDDPDYHLFSKQFNLTYAAIDGRIGFAQIRETYERMLNRLVAAAECSDPRFGTEFENGARLYGSATHPVEDALSLRPAF